MDTSLLIRKGPWVVVGVVVGTMVAFNAALALFVNPRGDVAGGLMIGALIGQTFGYGTRLGYLKLWVRDGRVVRHEDRLIEVWNARQLGNDNVSVGDADLPFELENLERRRQEIPGDHLVTAVSIEIGGHLVDNHQRIVR